ncbi:MAG: NUDIX hydrolase [Candidatus Dojkabacteria bacterium]|jgi:ADP-ribose pyrophosphatase
MKLVKEKTIYQNYRRLLLRTFVDEQGKTSEFEVSGSIYGSASIIALTEDNNIILVREFRPGPMKEFLDIPGGCLDDGENPVDCAIRELTEETGYVGTKATLLGKIFDGAYISNPKYAVLIEGCTFKEGSQTEDIEVVLKPYEEYLENLKPEDTVNLAALLLFKEYLRKKDSTNC